MEGDVITGLRSLVMSRFELCNGLLKLTWYILVLKSNTALYNYDHKSAKAVTPLNELQ